MALPKNDEQITIRLPESSRAKAEALAEADGRSLSAWVRQLVLRETGDVKDDRPVLKMSVLTQQAGAQPQAVGQKVTTRFKNEKS